MTKVLTRMAVIPALALLLLVQGGCASIITTAFDVANICEMSYGVILDANLERTTLACSNLCAKNVSCASFIYNPFTSACRTNMAEIPHHFTNCSTLVKYGSHMLSPYSTTPSPTGAPYLLGSYNGDTCTDTLDCVETMSECRDAICQCVEGYVYNFRFHTCVFITDCVNYGSTFQTITEREHTYAAIDSLPLAEADCISLCVTSTMYTCHIVSYDRNQQMCNIFDFTGVSMETILNKYDPEANSMIYQRDCDRIPPTMHNGCTSHGECHDRHSECSDGTCSCPVGLSYNVERRACVKECSLYAYHQMQEYVGLTIVGYVYQTDHFPMYNPNECRDACNFDETVDMVSAMLSYTESTCYCSEQTLGNYPSESGATDSSFALIQKDCQPLRAPMEELYCYNGQNVCTVTDSECRDGVCKCFIGLSYRPPGSTDSCVSNCNTYGYTFQTIVDFHVQGVAMITVVPLLSNDTVTECKVLCAKQTQFTCKMAVLKVLTAECGLYDVTLSSISLSQHVYNVPDYVTFQRDCD